MPSASEALAIAWLPTGTASCACWPVDVAPDWRLPGLAPPDDRTLRVRGSGATARTRRAHVPLKGEL
jgi:hypothetical protein